jgi:hypothetical protein
VIDNDGRLLGVLSENDIIALSPMAGTLEQRVADVMHQNVVVCDEAESFPRILQFLKRAVMPSVVVTSDASPVGIVSRAAALRFLHDVKWNKNLSSRAHGDGCTAGNDDGLYATFAALQQSVTQLGDFLHQRSEPRETIPIIAEASQIQGLVVELFSALGSVAPEHGALR